MAVSERRDGGAASKTVVNRFIRTKVNDIFFYVLHITLVRWLSSDDDEALELTISTEVLNMTFLSLLLWSTRNMTAWNQTHPLWRLLLVSRHRFCQFVLRENSLLLYQHSTCYLTEICGQGFAISVLRVKVPGRRRPFICTATIQVGLFYEVSSSRKYNYFLEHHVI